MTTACIIIPTTGADTLDKAVHSAVNQNHASTVLVVIDGREYAEKSRLILAKYLDYPDLEILELPANTGAAGFFGHRIYAATSFIVNQDYLLYLDQDNWYDPDHVSSQLAACESHNWSWSHSLRKICDLNGDYLLDDNCESLGRWPTYVSDRSHLVDTSCFCVSRAVATQIGQSWYSGWGGDRQFLANANHRFPQWGGTGRHTVNYRLAGNPGSVTAQFFRDGNAVMSLRYQGQFPWLR